MNKLIETRTISADSLRNMCIIFNYYDKGSMDEYFNMTVNAIDCENLTIDHIEKIARDIFNHTSGKLNLLEIVANLISRCDVKVKFKREIKEREVKNENLVFNKAELEIISNSLALSTKINSEIFSNLYDLVDSKTYMYFTDKIIVNININNKILKYLESKDN